MSHKVLAVPAAQIYDLYLAKAERKGRSKDELVQVLCWLTGYSPAGLAQGLRSGASLGDFVTAASWNQASQLITGSVCGVKVQDVEDPTMRRVREMDKVVDELAKGWPLPKIMRKKGAPAGRSKASKEPAMSPSDLPVTDVLDLVTGPRRAEADELLELFKKTSGQEPVVWAGRIIGFEQYQYTLPSGRSGVAPVLAFATGPKHHTVYLSANFAERWPDLLDRLGKHRASKACLYLTRLSGIDSSALEELLERTRDETMASPNPKP